MTRSFDTRGFIEANGKLKPLHVRILPPVSVPDEDDFFCRVHAPELIGHDKDIFGVDQSQAYELALKFVKSMIGDNRFVDADGLPLLPE